MISTKWLQGSNLEQIFSIRNLIFRNELGFGEEYVHDKYDYFALNVTVNDGQKLIGAGRLYFQNCKYVIDKVCVSKDFRGNSYGELILRMLIRKAISIGADCTYIYTKNNETRLYEKIGYSIVKTIGNDMVEMVREGDIGCSCKEKNIF